MVGIIPLFAVEVLEDDHIQQLPGFRKRMQWFLDNRKDLARHIAYCNRDCPDATPHGHRLLAIPSRERLERVLRYLLDEREFFSPHGIRALSRIHKEKPFVFAAGGMDHRVEYIPGESDSGMFGGNSNWRGPIWFPVNYLLIESLQKFHHYLGDDFKVECPTGSGRMMTLWEVSVEISRRLSRIFLRGSDGRRPVYGGMDKFQRDPHWRDLVLFHEYFHGDSGAGIGASHQTGWTGLVAMLISLFGRMDAKSWLDVGRAAIRRDARAPEQRREEHTRV